MKKLKNLILLTTAILLSVNNFGQYQKVNSHGLEIYYRIIGKGSPILIIGGGPGDVSDRYLSLCELLSKKFQCILVDQRGTGKSTPPVLNSSTISIALTLDDFEALRMQLGFKSWNVLGFSYGGFLASLYVNKFPESTSSLILLGAMGLNTNGFLHFADNITSRMRQADIELLEYWSDSKRMTKNSKHAYVEQIRARMPGYFYDKRKSLIVSQAIKDSDFNFKMGSLIWEDIAKNKIDLTKMESNFNRPVLILHGRQDPLGESVAHSLKIYYKNSNLFFIEKCGHYSWIEQPDEILTRIVEFMNTSNK